MNNYKEHLKALIPKEDREQVWLFFLAFSRFEYALKNSGFAEKSNKEEVTPAWNKFASQHCITFQNRLTSNEVSYVCLRDACGYFKDHPPEKQYLDHTLLKWKSSHPPDKGPTLCWLLIMLRRVRNNLFHGGKFTTSKSPSPDSARDSKLIKHSLSILSACITLHPGVEKNFKSNNY